MILAEIHTDDYKCSAFFDATSFFEQAAAEEIIGLKAIGWGGNHQADAIALFMLERDAGVTRVFRYLDENVTRSNGLPVGFECHVCEEDVVCWVRANRATWLPLIWDEIPGGARQAGEAVEEWKPVVPGHGANVRS